jgi:pimeloyl-ACP methyl ester carboxylesterase
MPTSYAAAAHFRLDAYGNSRSAVVLMHGLGGELNQLWGLASGNVGGHGAAVLAPDARAHGLTELPELGPLDFDVLADDMLRLVDHLKIGSKLVLVGLSMGAATALTAALREPQRVHGLVLVRPAWLHEPLPENLAALGEIAKLLRSVGPDKGRSIFEESEIYRSTRAISASGATSLLGQFDAPAAVERVRRLEDIPRSAPYHHPSDLEAITWPTLVIGAAHDPSPPLWMAEELARLVPGSKLTVITSRDLSPERNRADLEAAVEGFTRDLAPLTDAVA